MTSKKLENTKHIAFFCDCNKTISAATYLQDFTMFTIKKNN